MTVCGLSQYRRRADGSRAGRHDAGVVLIAALWLLVLLALVAGGMIELVRSERLIARNIVAEAQARALADAGIARGIAILLDRGQTQSWPIDGTPRPVELGGARIELAIQDELGRIDLNAAADDLLKGLLLSAGVRDAEADVLVDRILDWRDADDLKRLHGAEATDYAARGLAYGPRNGAFESVEELGQVLGITAALLDRIAPALTVFSRRSSIDMTTAPRAALLAVPGMDEAQIRQILATRGSLSSGRSGPAADASPGTTAAVSDLTGRAFSLTARIEAQDGMRVTRGVIIRFTGDPNRPYWIHEWR